MSAHSGACEEVLPTCEVPLRLCEAGPGGDLDSGGSRAELPRRLRLFIHAGIKLINYNEEYVSDENENSTSTFQACSSPFDVIHYSHLL